MGSYKKKLFIALLVILLTGFFVCGSVNAVQTYYQTDDAYKIDPYNYLTNYQEDLGSIFITLFDKYATVQQKATFDQLIEENWVYIRIYVAGGEYTAIEADFIPFNFNYVPFENAMVDTEISPYFDTNTLIPVTGYNISNSNLFRFFLRLNNTSVNHGYYNSTIFIPSLLINYNNKTITNYKNGIKPSSDLQFMIFQAIQENTEQQEETTDEMKKLNDFMSSEDVDQDAYDMPTNNPTQDPTTDGINNIFNKFYSRITNWDSSNISVYIPFANKSFTIPANASEQLLAKFSNMGLGSTLKSLISAVWFYVLARYIIKDVQKYVDGLKTGEILTKSDTNIKTEML